ncbi:MAG: vWA domain-containing protein, partial [Aggregatilineales bacterium]
MLTFTNPDGFILFVLIPIFGVFFVLRNLARAGALRRIGDTELVEQLLMQVSVTRRRLKIVLWLLVICLMILALARPIWGIETEVVETENAAVIFAVDISRSMDAEDVAPSRLARARFDILTLLDSLEGNDIGIVLFAGQAFPYMPLTYDLNAARIFVNAIDTSAISLQGTATGDALLRASAMFDERTGAKPVIVLLSDGENHEDDALLVARNLADEGVVIHTMVYGTAEGGIIPVYDETGNLVEYKSDAGGNLILTRPDESLLRNIAAATGGIFVGDSSFEALLETITTQP